MFCLAGRRQGVWDEVLGVNFATTVRVFEFILSKESPVSADEQTVRQQVYEHFRSSNICGEIKRISPKEVRR